LGDKTGIGNPYAIDLPLPVDERGWLMATDRAFEGMEVAYSYPTCCFPGVVKGWHRHEQHEDRMYCVQGLARVVVAHRRGDENAQPGSLQTIWYETKEWVSGPLSPRLVVIPPGWWHGFQALGREPCVIVNCPDRPYDPEDEEKMDLGAIPFEWGRVNG